MKTNRRQFIGPVVGSMAAIASSSLASNEHSITQIKLPGSDLKMSRMGFGTGSIGFRTKQARWVKNNPNQDNDVDNQ